MMLSPETWAFKRISWERPGPFDNQRQLNPQVLSVLWVVSSCICSFTWLGKPQGRLEADMTQAALHCMKLPPRCPQLEGSEVRPLLARPGSTLEYGISE